MDEGEAVPAPTVLDGGDAIDFFAVNDAPKPAPLAETDLAPLDFALPADWKADRSHEDAYAETALASFELVTACRQRPSQSPSRQRAKPRSLSRRRARKRRHLPPRRAATRGRLAATRRDASVPAEPG